MIIDLFKIPVYKKYLQLDNEDIARYCLLYREQDTGRTVSNTGYQSNNLTGEHKPLNSLFNAIIECAKEFATQLHIPTISLDNLWININGYKDFNYPHDHPRSRISGVYYVVNTLQGGNIGFLHPSARHIGAMWDDVTTELDCYTAPKFWLPSTPGVLYLFPSWLEHYVEPNKEQEIERISISFNLS